MGAAHREGMVRRGEWVERSSGAAPSLGIAFSALAEDVRAIEVVGELDLGTIPQLEDRLLGAVRSQGGVILDLTRLDFIDSSGIGLLIKAHRETESGAKLHTVVASGSQVDRVFKVVCIDRALPIFFDRDQAVAAFNGTPARTRRDTAA
jgi:anti-anti-sigma factor